MEAIDAQEREPAGEVIRVRVDDLTQQELGSDRQKLGFHGENRPIDAWLPALLA
jgi:hypothetical protein